MFSFMRTKEIYGRFAKISSCKYMKTVQILMYACCERITYPLKQCEKCEIATEVGK